MRAQGTLGGGQSDINKTAEVNISASRNSEFKYSGMLIHLYIHSSIGCAPSSILLTGEPLSDFNTTNSTLISIRLEAAAC